MNWNELFDSNKKPDVIDFKKFIDSVLFDDLLLFVETDYSLAPMIEYSKCPAAPGWNIKFKKSGKSLCVVYPAEKYFTVLVTVGKKEEEAARELIKNFSDYTKELFSKTRFVCGGYWLMMDIKNKKTLEEAKKLMSLRVPKKK